MTSSTQTKKIKYCVWDVGKVIYNFSFAPLDVWCQKETQNLSLYLSRRGKLDYDDYMRGLMSFEDWCRNLCSFYVIPWSPARVEEINLAMHQGISPQFPVTTELMQEMNKAGIENCILSNALPNLADGGDFKHLVKPEHRFTSFEIGKLKPEPEIYEFVRRSLNCRFDEMIFIDDKSENVKAAAELGIFAFLFKQETIREDLSPFLK